MNQNISYNLEGHEDRKKNSLQLFSLRQASEIEVQQIVFA